MNFITTNSRWFFLSTNWTSTIAGALEWHEIPGGGVSDLGHRLTYFRLARPSGGWGPSVKAPWHTETSQENGSEQLRNICPELRRNGTKISSALQIISSQNWWAEKRKVLLRNCCLGLDIGFFLLTALFVNYFPFYLLTASWSRNPVSELSSNPPPQNWNSRNCEVKLSSFPD